MIDSGLFTDLFLTKSIVKYAQSVASIMTSSSEKIPKPY
jgi:hypothetical protein